jgi:transcriptional regulator with XRE-family HTH domain
MVMNFREATDKLGVPLEEVARATNRSYGTILAYRRGDRQPPREVLSVIAQLMREQSRDLEAAAKRLDGS